MVKFRHDIKQRHGYVFQINLLSTQLHLVFYKEVLLVAVFEELPEGFTCLIGAVEYPFLHSQKVPDSFFISKLAFFITRFAFNPIKQAYILVNHKPERVCEQEPGIQEIPGHYSIVIHDLVHVQVLCPDVEKPFICIKVHRSY